MNPNWDSTALASGKPLIQLSGVEVAFRGRPVLENIDLTIRSGQIITLVGPNGAGKSTLLKVALGLLEPSRGKVTRQPGLTVGYVPQRLSIDPVLPLTAERFLGLAQAPGAAEIEEVLREVGAPMIRERPVQELSGGETQRLLLARALLRHPDLLILDEPLQGVDFGGQIALFNLIGRLRAERGYGVVLVSHDLHIVMAGTDQVLCLNRHICCSGRPESVTQHPEYLALFGPQAAQRLAIYQHDHDHDHDLTGTALTGRAGDASADRHG